MPQSSELKLRNHYKFNSFFLLSDPELDELEKHPSNKDIPLDITFEDLIPENAPLRHNVPKINPEKEINEDDDKNNFSNDNGKRSDESWRDNPPNQDPLPNP